MDSIFGLSHLTYKHRINYNNWNPYGLLVHSYNEIVKLIQTNEGLYNYITSNEYVEIVASENSMHTTPISEINNMVPTLKENKKGYIHQQFYQSKRSIKLYQDVVCPNVEDFKHLLRQDMIKKFLVTNEDINIAGNFLGPYMGELKGKTNRHNPKIGIYDTIEILPEIRDIHKYITLLFYIIHVNVIPFC